MQHFDEEFERCAAASHRLIGIEMHMDQAGLPIAQSLLRGLRDLHIHFRPGKAPTRAAIGMHKHLGPNATGSCTNRLDNRSYHYALPLLEGVLASNHEHIERAVETVLRAHKKKVGLLGLSFKAGTDDLRESPQVQLTKRLMGEGCEIRIWDPQVSLGQLTGANRQFIHDVIPHIGSLLSPSLQEVVEISEVILIATSAVKNEMLRPFLKPAHTVIDLVNLEKSRRIQGSSSYEGICW